MSLDKLMDAIGQIDPVYVEEAEQWKGEADQRREKRQKKAALRRRLLHGALPTAACLALILMGAFFVIQNGGGAKKNADGSSCIENDYSNEDGAKKPGNPNSGAASEEKNNQTANETDKVGDVETVDGLDCFAGQEYPITMNEIKVIETTCVPEASAVAVTSTLSMEELQSYYGMAVQPSWLPEDMALSDYRNPALQPEWANQSNGAGQPDGSGQSVLQVGYDEAGNVVNDNNTLYYRDDTGKRELFLSVRTVEAGWIASLGEGQWETTEIQDRPVLMGHYRDSTAADCYIAIFKKENVTFTIITKGFSKQELCKVLINEVQK